MVTDQINHDPAHTMMNTGTAISGRPSMGSWVTYGLGSESDDLPGFVVMTSFAGRNPQPISQRMWGNGFLPGRFQGVEFNSTGDPVYYLRNPKGVSDAASSATWSTRSANSTGTATRRSRNPEVETRIAQYEMAFRMQASVPELMDISKEPKETLELYGAKPGDGSFASNCLMARRLAERGVRFIQLYHRDWDHHGDLVKYMNICCGATDRATWALLTDLKRRDMLEGHAGDLGRRVRPHADVPGQGRAGPRPPHQGVLDVAGRRRGEGRRRLRGDRRAGLQRGRERRSTSATCTRRCCTCSASTTSGSAVKYQGLDMRLTGVEPARVVKDILA